MERLTYKRARARKLVTQNVRIDILVEGIDNDKEWKCGVEFDFGNLESIYCRPLLISSDKNERMSIPEIATQIKIAYLPPMSGLAAIEPRYFPGRINVLIGEGRTAEVLRNLCYNLVDPEYDLHEKWKAIVNHIETLFGVVLNDPVLIIEKGEITLSYQETGISKPLDITSAGRGLHQTLLLLAWLYSNPNSVLLIDEPDAHLEILRQREIYQLLTEVAHAQSSQIIAASHSEVILNEAAQKSTLIAFLGKPHRIDDRGTQLLKSLKSIGFDQYALAKEKGWILYLEGSTDLSILRTFAKKLEHPVLEHLERPFIKYVNNLPNLVADHFYGIRDATPDIVGVAIFDNISSKIHSNENLIMDMWRRNEIENYLFYPEVLERYTTGTGQTDITAFPHKEIMNSIVTRRIPPLALEDRTNDWWVTIKASAFLDDVFEAFYKEMKLPNIMRKTNYHELAHIMPTELIVPEVGEKLDLILRVANKAKPIN